MNDQTNQKLHSVKVPRIYKQSAGILAAFIRGEGSVKDLVYNQTGKNRHPRIKAVYALVSEAARNENILSRLFSKTGLIEKEHPLDPCLAKILASELLWGKGLLKAGNSKPVLTLLKYEKELKKNTDISITSKKNNSKYDIPRYVRVNLLVAANVNRVIATLKSDGFQEQFYDKDNTSYSKFLVMVEKLEVNQFLVDFHFDDLLAFGAGTTFFDYKLYDDGVLILQDKASCLAVEALNPPPGSCILDACAAPGMKTLQAVSKTNSLITCSNNRTIAVERDFKRCKTLRSLVQKYGAGNIQVINSDFLELRPNDFSHVEYIVLDPSCSGSGIFHRNEQNEQQSSERIEKLANLQTKLLRHALSFPNVIRVAYSTCSIHKEENEEVVIKVLNGDETHKPIKHFRLKENCLPTWERRGLSEYGELAKSFIRSEPKTDLGIGFFVSVLEKVSGDMQCKKTSKRNSSPSDIPKKKKKSQ